MYFVQQFSRRPEGCETKKEVDKRMPRFSRFECRFLDNFKFPMIKTHSCKTCSQTCSNAVRHIAFCSGLTYNSYGFQSCGGVDNKQCGHCDWSDSRSMSQGKSWLKGPCLNKDARDMAEYLCSNALQPFITAQHAIPQHGLETMSCM